jgi:hypothetical protein
MYTNKTSLIFLLGITIGTLLFFGVSYSDAKTLSGTGWAEFCGDLNNKGTPGHIKAYCKAADGRPGAWTADPCNWTSTCDGGNGTWTDVQLTYPECCSTCPEVGDVKCDYLDGWYDTGKTRWVADGCEGDKVREKKQKEQEERNYYCSGTTCKYGATTPFGYRTRWVDTGETRTTTNCAASCKVCSNGSCVWPSGVTNKGTGGCVSFCGKHRDGYPYHSNACCNGNWWYDACNWKSCCSTGWYNVSGYKPECCDTCSATADIKCPDGSRCQAEKCVLADEEPIGWVQIGELSTKYRDPVPVITGWAYDPDTDGDGPDTEENVKIQVIYNGQYSLTYFPSTSVGGDTNRWHSGAGCSGLGGYCGFRIALYHGYLNDGANTIQVYAIDPDDNSKVLINQGTFTPKRISSCSGPVLTIPSYVYNRPNTGEIWTGCLDYVVSRYGASSPYGWRGPYHYKGMVWPDTWPEDGREFDAVKAYGYKPHLKGGGSAYTAGILQHSSLTEVNGYNYEAEQECAYIIQDNPNGELKVNDPYGDGYEDNPLCVALGASKTSITQGEAVRLAWETSNVDSADLSGASPVPLNGTQWVYPTQTTTYTLTAAKNGIETITVSECTCTPWSNQGCGVSPCDIDEMKQTRTCDPPGCDIEEQCQWSSVCQHRECNESNQCVLVPGAGTDQCTTDEDCQPAPLLPRWYEVVPR